MLAPSVAAASSTAPRDAPSRAGNLVHGQDDRGEFEGRLRSAAELRPGHGEHRRGGDAAWACGAGFRRVRRPASGTLNVQFFRVLFAKRVRDLQDEIPSKVCLHRRQRVD